MYAPAPPPLLSPEPYLTCPRRHKQKHNHRVQNLRRPRHQRLNRVLLQQQTLPLRLPTRTHALPSRHRKPHVPMGLQHHVVWPVRVPALQLGAHYVRGVAGRAAAVATGTRRVHDDAAAGGICDGVRGEGEDGDARQEASQGGYEGDGAGAVWCEGEVGDVCWC
jgi:hypothetical protein